MRFGFGSQGGAGGAKALPESLFVRRFSWWKKHLLPPLLSKPAMVGVVFSEVGKKIENWTVMKQRILTLHNEPTQSIQPHLVRAPPCNLLWPWALYCPPDQDETADPTD